MDRNELSKEALEAWRYAREGVLAELRNIPAGRWDYRPAEESRDVSGLARHIAESGLMAAGELTRPDGDFTRQDYPAFLREYAADVEGVEGKDALIGLLERTLEEGLARLHEAGDLLFEPIKQFNGTPATRYNWLHHAIAHEEYHRGQIAIYARCLGLVPALTQRIHG